MRLPFVGKSLGKLERKELVSVYRNAPTDPRAQHAVFQALVTKTGGTFEWEALVGWFDQNYGEFFRYSCVPAYEQPGVPEMPAWEFFDRAAAVLNPIYARRTSPPVR